MNNKAYILATLNDAGVRRNIAAAESKADLIAIADKYTTQILKNGFFELVRVLEEDDIDKTDNSNIFKVYHLYPAKRYRREHPDYRLIVLELYEIPTETADDHTADLDRIFAR